jgi:hypothetical protein
MNASPTAAALLADLSKTPDDERLRERAARAQQSEGDVEGAFETLTQRLINVTAHAKSSPLPSLHRKAIKAALVTADLDGEPFDRDFVCARGRVLFFWRPRSLERVAEQVRDAVRQRLDRKLERYDEQRRGRNRSLEDEE